MKVLFLILTIIPFIFNVHAQRHSTQYTCQARHKYSETAFYLDEGQSKEFEVGGWKLYAAIKRMGSQTQVSLSRVVTVLDATYKRNAERRYPLNAHNLPVTLEHSFGGRTDIFNMVCYPRDP